MKTYEKIFFATIISVTTLIAISIGIILAKIALLFNTMLSF